MIGRLAFIAAGVQRKAALTRQPVCQVCGREVEPKGISDDGVRCWPCRADAPVTGQEQQT